MSGEPMMSPIWAARDIARSLMQHYGVDPEAHFAEQLEFADEVGEELLSLARRFLEEKGLLAPAGTPAGPQYDPATLLRAHPDGPDPTGPLVDLEDMGPGTQTGAGE